MQCSSNFFDYLVSCPDNIRVNVKLPILPYVFYNWIITDKFGNQFSGDLQSDEEGYYIPVDQLPDGSLTAYSGSFSIQFYQSGVECKAVPFLAAKYYDKMNFEVQPGTRVKDYLGCAFECEVIPTGNSAVFPFTDEANVTIPWTDLLSSLYGDTPNIQVYHEVAPGVYQLANVAVQIDSPLTELTVDNGGSASGYIFIS